MTAFAGYVVFFAGVYKLFQMATTLGEIKELLKGQRRNEFPVPAVPSVAAVAGSGDSLPEDDAASEYARNLLRTVSIESQRAAGEPHQIS